MDADRKATLTGVAISLGGNVLISLALNVQKLAHKRLAAAASRPSTPRADDRGDAPASAGRRPSPPAPQRASDEETSLLAGNGGRKNSSVSSLERNSADEDDTPGGEANFLASPLWWSGLLLLAIGETANFISYGFSPASVVAPLGTAALVANWLFAPLILGERFRSQDTLGVSLAIIGASTIVLSARTTQPVLDPSTLVRALSRIAFIVYSTIVAALIVILAILAESGHDSDHLLVDIVLCALLGGFTVLSTKAVSALFSSLVWNAFRQPIFYSSAVVLLVTALGQLRYLNRALQRFSSKHVVPAQFACFTLSVLIGSSVLYRDFDDVSPRRFMTFVLGLTTTLVGVALLAPEGGSNGDKDEDDDDAGSQRAAAEAVTAGTEAGEGGLDRAATALRQAASPSTVRWSTVDCSISPARSSTSVRGRSPSSARTPLLPAIQLDSPPRPRSQSRPGAGAGLPVAHHGASAGHPQQTQHKPRLRRSSTASVRALSAGGILLSSSLGSTRGPGGHLSAAVVVHPPGQLALPAAAVGSARPDLVQ